MSGKCDESPEKKKKKVDRTKFHFKQENLVTPIIGHSVTMWYLPAATGRRRLRYALANAIFIRHNRNYFD